MKNPFQNTPRSFGTFYLICIPLFAFLYYALPNLSFKTDLNMDFLTCLYFSTVTITTLGFGDISPLSALAQIIVIIESISGIVLIGLFLNSLAQKKSQTISEQEKIKSASEKFANEKEKLLRYNKLAEQNIQFYFKYTAIITTPILKRPNGSETELNRDFTFNDLSDLFLTTLTLRDSDREPGVYYYYLHQNNLISSITNLLLNVDLSNWKELELDCIGFLNNCKIYDFSKSILEQPRLMVRNQKASESDAKMIAEHKGEIKYLPSNTINQYIALYELIKKNIEFLDAYDLKIKKIESE